MTDFDEAISNGLVKALNKQVTLLKCYFHLAKNIKKHLKLADKQLKYRIICHISAVISTKLFLNSEF